MIKLLQAMKFTGMHLHLILVAAVICVVLYVFYISRDIVLIDKEVKALHAKLDMIVKSGNVRPNNAAGIAPAPAQPSQASTPYPTSQQPSSSRPPAAPPSTTQQQQQQQQRSMAPVASPAVVASPAPQRVATSFAPAPQTAKPSVTKYVDDIEDDLDVTDDDDDDVASSIDIQAQVSKLSSINDDDGDDASSSSSDTTEKLKELLDAVAEEEEEHDEAPAAATPEDGFDKLSWNEIKERCKKLNIPIRGSTKDQLIQKLKQSSSAST
jgi:hypothetical protein